MADHIRLLSLLMLAEGFIPLQSLKDQMFTRNPCALLNERTDTDCDAYDSDVFIPSAWNGNYTCANDYSILNISLTFRNPHYDRFILDAYMKLNNDVIYLLGSFTFFLRTVILRSFDIPQSLVRSGISKVKFTGHQDSQTKMDGEIRYYIENEKYNCPVKLTKERREAFIPSTWNGNFICSNANLNISLTFRKVRADLISFDSFMKLNKRVIDIPGSFEPSFRIVTLHSEDIFPQGLFGSGITKIKFIGHLKSPTNMDGEVWFYNEKGIHYCPMKLRKEKILGPTIWCNGHGQCRRYGRQRDQYICCCDQGYTGSTCLTPRTPITSTTTIATPSSISVVEVPWSRGIAQDSGPDSSRFESRQTSEAATEREKSQQ